jgi:hypothetical protein
MSKYITLVNETNFCLNLRVQGLLDAITEEITVLPGKQKATCWLSEDGALAQRHVEIFPSCYKLITREGIVSFVEQIKMTCTQLN